jgi:hypothetical protein
MEPDAITQYISETFDGVEVVVASGDTFFMVDPGDQLPFATLVTSDDEYDNFSNLSRPGVYRLSIGVSPGTFRSLIGSSTVDTGDDGDAVSGHDYTVLDQFMPHPVYGKMFWICVLNPSPATFDAARPLLAEAHDRARGRRAKTRPEVTS